MIAVTRQLHRQHAAHGRTLLSTAPTALESASPGSVPRISRLVALSLRLDELLRTGRIESLSALARAARITQPRATQLLALSLLAPDIIEELLHLPAVVRGRAPITERMVRPIASVPLWAEQRRIWRALRGAPSRALGQSSLLQERA